MLVLFNLPGLWQVLPPLRAFDGRTALLFVYSRPVSDGRVVDVVHEFSRAPSLTSSASSDAVSRGGGGGGGGRGAVVAEATLTGSLNGKPLWLQRRKGARVNQLFLEHDGKDLTRQVAKYVLVRLFIGD